jgi:hypothetical protein
MQDNLITIAFADVKIPDFKEQPGEKVVMFGEDNKYPDYLIMLLNKSAKHNSIINSKVNYIFGNGLKAEEEDETAMAFIKKNTKLIKKITHDKEAFGMGYIQCIPKRDGITWGFHHLSYNRMRSNVGNTYFEYRKDWQKRWDGKAKCFPAFDPTKRVTSVLMFKEYRAGLETYSLPSFVAACNYIEADIEVSKHTLTNAQSGFSASKFINFYNGEPDEMTKRSIEARFKNKFGGASGEKMIIGFNNDPAKAPTVQDLGASDLTKEDFQQVDNLIANNIYAGHQITNSSLFGIPSYNHSLGGNSGAELKMAYDIFKSTYVAVKKKEIEDIINFIAACNGVTTELTLIDIEPVGYTFTEATIMQTAPRPWLLEKLGIDETKYESTVTKNAVVNAINTLSPLVANKVLEKMTPDEIRSIVGLGATPGGNVIETAATGGGVAATTTSEPMQDGLVNENLKNLTAKQMQQVNRIIRQHSKGQITDATAMLLLTNGFGLTEEQARTMLGLDQPETDQFGSDDDVAMLFAAHGEPADDYQAFEKRTAKFVDEYTDIEDKIKILREKNPKATAKSIAKTLNVEEAIVEEYITGSTGGTIGGAIAKIPKFEVRYSYELRAGVPGPDRLPTTRPFCVKMLALNRLYTRADIQKISAYLGYDVMKRSGGFWNNNGTIEFHCRHEFFSQIVVKKKK